MNRFEILGRKLKSSMRTSESYEILTEKYNTWGEGGCRILARALSPVISGDIWTAVSDNQPQHYVVHKDDYLFDYLGAQTINDFRNRYHKEEGLLVAFAPYEMRCKEIPSNKLIENRLQEYLSRKLKFI